MPPKPVSPTKTTPKSTTPRKTSTALKSNAKPDAPRGQNLPVRGGGARRPSAIDPANLIKPATVPTIQPDAEQERVQKKTFTKWFNTYLSKCETENITDLYTDIRDGLKLLTLLEVLGKTTLPKEHPKVMQRVHHLSNLQTATKYLESRKINMVNVNPADIGDGKPTIVLGLMWRIILFFQIEDDLGSQATDKSGKQQLLKWAEKMITDKFNIPIKDFSSSWRSGLAFSALVNTIKPRLIDLSKCERCSNKENLELAFNKAASELGIPRLLDPEDVDVDKPDEKSIMTYVGQFFKTYPEGSSTQKKLQTKTGAREEKSYKDVKDFLNGAEKIIPPKGSVVENVEQEHNTFCRVDLKHLELQVLPSFRFLTERWKKRKLEWITPAQVDALLDQWERVEDLLGGWKRRLDNLLPEGFKNIGHWLGDAESWLRQRWDYPSDQECWEKFRERQAEHKDIFPQKEHFRKLFDELKNSEEAQKVNVKYLAALRRRFMYVEEEEGPVKRKLDCMEAKYHLLVRALECDRKHIEWMDVKTPEEIAQSYKDYKDFVVNKNYFGLVEEDMKTFLEKAKIYSDIDLQDDPDERKELEDFRIAMDERFAELFKDLKLQDPMFPVIIKNWKEFDVKLPDFNTWLDVAEEEITKNELMSLESGAKKHEETNKLGEQLTAQMGMASAAVVQDQLNNVNDRWNNLCKTNYDSQMAILKQENEEIYDERANRLKEWTEKVQNLVDTLSRDDLPANDYMEALVEFQSLVRNRPSVSIDDLKESLKALEETNTEEELENFRAEIQEIEANMTELEPKIKDTESKAGIKAECLKYLEEAEKEKTALLETKKAMQKLNNPDDLESALKMLKEQEGIMDNLKKKTTPVNNKLAEGTKLSKTALGDSLVGSTTDELKTLWTDSNSEALEKLKDLKGTADAWKDYDVAKKEVTGTLDKLLPDINSKMEVSGQDSIKAELKDKESQLKKVSELKKEVDKMKENAKYLKTKVSDKKGKELDSNIDQLERKIALAEKEADAKIAKLKDSNEEWTTLYSDMKEMDALLNKKQSELDKVNKDAKLTPDKKVELTEQILNDVKAAKEKMKTLLGQGDKLSRSVPKSREVTNMKSDLDKLSKRFNDFNQQITERAASASESLNKINEFDNLMKKWNDFVKISDEYQKKSLPLVNSSEDIKQLQESQSNFEKELIDAKTTYQQLDKIASQLSGEKSVQEKFDKASKQWQMANSKSNEKRNALDKLEKNFNEYEKEFDNLQSSLADIENKAEIAGQLPVDKKISEFKSLSEKAKGLDKAFVNLDQSFNSLKSSLNPNTAKTKQTANQGLNKKWKDVLSKLSGDLQQQNVVREEIESNKNELREVKAWLTKADATMNDMKEVFTDEVPEVLSKLKNLKNECADMNKKCELITKQVNDLSTKVTPTEIEATRKEIGNTPERLSDLSDLIVAREELCEAWIDHEQNQREWMNQLKIANNKLSSVSLREEDMSALNTQLSKLLDKAPDYLNRGEEIDKMMLSAKMKIKERNSKKQVSCKDLISNLLKQMEESKKDLDRKKQQFEAAANTWNSLKDLKSDIDLNLKDIEKQLDNLALPSINENHLQTLRTSLDDIQHSLDEENKKLTKLQTYTSDLAKTDASKSSESKGLANSAKFLLDQLEAHKKEKDVNMKAVEDNLAQYNNCQKVCDDLIDDYTEKSNAPSDLSTFESIKKHLELIRQLEQKVVSDYHNFENLTFRSQQLIKECENFKQFQPKSVEEKANATNAKWKSLIEDLKNQRLDLERRLSQWKRLKEVEDEIDTWLDGSIKKLEDATNNGEDASIIESKLEKFNNERPHYEKMMGLMDDIIADLSKNQNLSPEQLEAIKKKIQDKFNSAKELDKGLKNKCNQLSGQKDEIQEQLKNTTDKLAAIRDEINELDNHSGTDQDIVDRIERSKQLQEDLATLMDEANDALNHSKQLSNDLPSAEADKCIKDAEMALKKASDLDKTVDTVQQGLKKCLAQRLEDAKAAQQSWIKAVKEKVDWANRFSGDSQSNAQKLATLEDLISNLQEGEEITEEVLVKNSSLLRAGAPRRGSEINEDKVRSNFGDLAHNLMSIREKLAGTQDELGRYEEMEKSMSDWIKESEDKLKKQKREKKDNLGDKKEKLKELDDLLKQAEKEKEAEMKKIISEAQRLGQSMDDPKLQERLHQLQDRFDKMKEQLKDQKVKAESEVAAHDDYEKKEKDILEWLRETDAKLKRCMEMPANDSETALKKQEEIKKLLQEKAKGQEMLMAALDAGKATLASTSPDGQAAIREELQKLENSWDDYNEKMSDLQQEVATSIAQWSSFDDSIDRLKKWQEETDLAIDQEAGLRDSLPDKRSALHQCRDRLHDISAHQKVLDDLITKSQTPNSSTLKAAPSAQSKSKKVLDEAKLKFNRSHDRAKQNLSNLEQYVGDHQKYEDARQNAAEWLASNKDAFQLCQAKLTPDKLSLQSCASKVDALEKALTSGDKALKLANDKGQIVMTQSGTVGQNNLQFELANLEEEFEKHKKNLGTSKEELARKKVELQKLEASYQQLHKWIKEKEAALKVKEMGGSCKQKESQLNKYLAEKENIAQKEDEIEEFTSSLPAIQKLDDKLHDQAEKLCQNYDNLQKQVDQMIDNWNGYVEDHQLFDNNTETLTQNLESFNKSITPYASVETETADEMAAKMSEFDEIIGHLDHCQDAYQDLICQGDNLIPNTSSDGRLKIRQQLRSIRDVLEEVTDRSDKIRRDLEEKSSNLLIYEEAAAYLKKNLNKAEQQLQEMDVLKDTLELKRDQIRQHKTVHQELLLQKNAFDSLQQKAYKTVSGKAESDSSRILSQYRELCNTSDRLLNVKTNNLLSHGNYDECLGKNQQLITYLSDQFEQNKEPVGDKITLEMKLDRLEELNSELERALVEQKDLNNLAVSAAETVPPEAGKVMSREVEQLNHQTQDLHDNTTNALDQFKRILDAMSKFDKEYHDLRERMKLTEAKLKKLKEGSTLEEKENCLNEIKKLGEDVEDISQEYEQFKNTSESILSITQDSSVTHHVEDLGIYCNKLEQTTLKKLQDWQAIISHHQEYKRQAEDWSTQLAAVTEAANSLISERLSMNCDIQSLIQKSREVLDERVNEHLYQKLEHMHKFGDIVSHESAPAGREIIRSELRACQGEFDKMEERATQIHSQFLHFDRLLSSFCEARDSARQWFEKTDQECKDRRPRNSLKDFESYLDEMKNLYQDILVHRYLFEISEKSNSLDKAIAGTDQWSQITKEAFEHFEEVKSAAETKLNEIERSTNEYRKYCELLKTSEDLMDPVEEQLESINETTGEIQELQSRLDKVKAIQYCLPDIEATIQKCNELSSIVSNRCDPDGKENISHDMENLMNRWHTLLSEVARLEEALSSNISSLKLCDQRFEESIAWGRQQSKKLKTFGNKSTVEEKRVALEEIEKIHQEIIDYEFEISQCCQTIMQTTQEIALREPTDLVDKLNNAYQSLLHQCREELELAANKYEAHQKYAILLEEFKKMLSEIETLYHQLQRPITSKNEFLENFQIFEKLSEWREFSQLRLNELEDAADKVIPNTAFEGREVIKQDIISQEYGRQTLFEGFEMTREAISLTAQEVEGLESNIQHLENKYLKLLENRNLKEAEICDTLEEKLQAVTNCHHSLEDLHTDMDTVDGMAVKIDLLPIRGAASNLEEELSTLKDNYGTMLNKAKDLLPLVVSNVEQHEQYELIANQFSTWLDAMRTKMQSNSSLEGDIHTVKQHNAEIKRLCDIQSEGEDIMERFKQQSELVSETTAKFGRNSIDCRVQDLEHDWMKYKMTLSRISEELDDCATKWQDYHDSYNSLADFVSQMNKLVRDIQLKATLEEKMTELEQMNEYLNLCMGKSADFHALLSKTRLLETISKQPQFTEAVIKLSDRNNYLIKHLEDLADQWEHYIEQHQTFEDMLEELHNWLNCFRDDLNACCNDDNHDTKHSVHNKLEALNELLMKRDIGHHKLIQLQDQMHSVIPETESSGRDKLKSYVIELQAGWDSHLSVLNLCHCKIEALFAHWNLFEELEQQIESYVTESECMFDTQNFTGASLQNKMQHVERVKHLQVTVSTYENQIQQLEKRAAEIEIISESTAAKTKALNLRERYTNLMTSVSRLLTTCEEALKSHHLYEDAATILNKKVGTAHEQAQYLMIDAKADRASTEANLEALDKLSDDMRLLEELYDQLQGKAETVKSLSDEEGKDLVVKEVREVRNQLEEQKDYLANKQDDLINTLNQWKIFDDDYQNLIDWLKSTEEDVKSGLDYKATLPEKKSILDKAKGKRAAVLKKEIDFKNLMSTADSLLQHSTDLKLNTKLSQMIARYHSLTALSEEIVKKCDQIVLDHEEYKTQHNTAEEWLENALDLLEKCRDTPADKYAAQEQLNKLRDLAATKEDGMALLDSVRQWLDRVSVTTSVSGRAKLNAEVDVLADKLQELDDIKEVRQDLEDLSVCLSEYSSTLELLENWMKEIAARIDEFAVRKDFNDKLVQLQRAKGLIIEMESGRKSFEENMSKLETLGKEYEEINQAKQLWEKYDTLETRAKNFVEKSQQMVDQHQSYQTKLIDFNNWFKKSKEELTTKCDTYGNIEIIKEKLNRVECLIKDFDNGRRQFNDIQTVCDEVKRNTSNDGHPKLCNEITQIDQNLQLHQEQLQRRKRSLEECLHLWNEFLDNYQKLDKCLKESDTVVHEDIRPMSTKEEKENIFRTYQNNHDKLVSLQPTFESLSDVATDLETSNSDPSIPQMMTELTIAYQSQMATSQDVLRRLESQCQEHSQLEAKCDEFMDWVSEFDEELKQLNARQPDEVNISQMQSEVKNVENAYDDGRNRLCSVEEFAERTKQHTNRAGCEAIDIEIDTLRKHLVRTGSLIENRKDLVEKRAAGLQECNRSLNHLTEWLDGIENRYQAETRLLSNIQMKKATLQRVRAMMLEIDSKEVFVKRLVDRAPQLNDERMMENVHDIDERYHTVKSQCEQLSDKLEEDIAGIQEYQEAVKAAESWLDSAGKRFDNLSEEKGSIQECEHQLEELRPFKLELHREGQLLIDEVVNVSDYVVSSGGLEQADVLNEIETLQMDFNKLKNQMEGIERNLREIVSRGQNHKAGIKKFNDWIKDIESNLRKKIDSGGDYETKMKQIYKYKTINEEIVKKGRELERLQKEGNELHESTHDKLIINSLTLLQSRYEDLLSNCKKNIDKLSQRMDDVVADQKAYEDAYATARSWITNSSEKLSSCDQSAGVHEDILDRVNTCQEISGTMSHGQSLVDKAVECGMQALKGCSVDASTRLRQSLEKLKTDWNELGRRVDQVGNKLNKMAAKWSHYGTVNEKLLKWLVDAEKFLDGTCTQIEIVDKKTIVDRLKLLKRECDIKANEVTVLTKLGNDLQVGGCQQPQLQERTVYIQNRFETVRTRISKILDIQLQIQENFTDYQKSLHDCERWILATSHSINSPATLSAPSDLETALNIRDQHRDIVQEIKAYKKTMNQLAHLGRHLLEENQLAPDMLEQIESQMNSIQDSFLNLEKTASQVMERLNDNCQKWRDYKAALAKGEDFLNETLFHWWLDKEYPTAQSLQNIAYQIDDTKKMKKKLQTLVREVANCARNCEMMASSQESFVTSPTPPQSARPPSLRQRPNVLSSHKTNGSNTSPQDSHSNFSDIFTPVTGGPITIRSPSLTQMHNEKGQFDKEAADALSRFDDRLQSLNELKVRWDKWLSNRDEMAEWLHKKKLEVKDSTLKPALLEDEDSKHELLKLEELKTEVEYMEPDVFKLKQTFLDLTGDPKSFDDQLDALISHYGDIRDHLKRHIDSRQNFRIRAAQQAELDRQLKYKDQNQQFDWPSEDGSISNGWSSTQRANTPTYSRPLSRAGHSDGRNSELRNFIEGPSRVSPMNSHNSSGTQTPCNHATQTKDISTENANKQLNSGRSSKLSASQRGMNKGLWPYSDPTKQLIGRSDIKKKATEKSRSPTRGSGALRPYHSSTMLMKTPPHTASTHSLSREQAVEELMNNKNPSLEDGTHSLYAGSRYRQRSISPARSVHSLKNDRPRSESVRRSGNLNNSSFELCTDSPSDPKHKNHQHIVLVPAAPARTKSPINSNGRGYTAEGKISARSRSSYLYDQPVKDIPHKRSSRSSAYESLTERSSLHMTPKSMSTARESLADGESTSRRPSSPLKYNNTAPRGSHLSINKSHRFP